MAVQLVADLVIAERFRLGRLIGRGGMGSVWQATHLGLDIPCAVKFIEGDIAQHPEAQSRFEREAKAAAQLRSPHVVQILDHGVFQGTPYIAMELLDGEDLGKRIQRSGRLGAVEVVTVITQVCRALAKAHAAGIVHRDLKPDNIFLVHDDDREIAKVLDFGIAKANSTALDGSNTKTGAMLGTPYYMSPEQAQGTKAVDHRADLWSLAIIVYQCMTGKLPFESEALGDLLVKIIVNPIPVPSKVAPDITPAFDAWWERAASRDPAARFQSAKEFAEALSLAFGLSSMTSVMDRGQLRASMASFAGDLGGPMAQSHAGTAAPGTATPSPAATPRPGTLPLRSSSSGHGTTGAPIARTYSGLNHTLAPKKRAAVAVAAAPGAAVVFGALGLTAFFIMKGKGNTAAAASAGLIQDAPAMSPPPPVERPSFPALPAETAAGAGQTSPSSSAVPSAALAGGHARAPAPAQSATQAVAPSKFGSRGNVPAAVKPVAAAKAGGTAKPGKPANDLGF